MLVKIVNNLTVVPSIILAVCLATCILIIRWYIKRSIHLYPLKKLPGLRPHFIYGNFFNLMRLVKKLKISPGAFTMERMLGSMMLFQKEGLQLFWVGPVPIIGVFGPELIEIILSSSTNIDKSFEYAFLHKWIGLGLLTSTGSKWKTRRKMLTPCFHFQILEDFMQVFNEQSLILVNKLKGLKDSTSVDLLPMLVLCTLDIVCETVMGCSIRAQKGNNLDYAEAIRNLEKFFVERTLKPLLWWDFTFNYSSLGKKFNKDLHILHLFTRKVIKEKKEELLKMQKNKNTNVIENEELGRPRRKRALMDLLLELHMTDQQLTETDIQEEVDTFMFEGHDTTSMGLQFALYSIGLYPKIQEKIYKELQDIFEGDERPVTMDDARKMKYLECVLKESQRVFPSVPMLARSLSEDVHYKDYTIPSGTTVHCNIICLHMNPQIFPNPQVFDPDRFLPDSKSTWHPFAYIPFSAGPRNCIGQKFALLEEKVAICQILRHFEVRSLQPRDKVILGTGLTLKSEKAILFEFKPRKNITI